jgi:hypothetical protein
MQEQVQRRRSEIDAMKKMKDTVDDMGSALPPKVGGQTDEHANGDVTNGHVSKSLDNEPWTEFDE